MATKQRKGERGICTLLLISQFILIGTILKSTRLRGDILHCLAKATHNVLVASSWRSKLVIIPNIGKMSSFGKLTNLGQTFRYLPALVPGPHSSNSHYSCARRPNNPVTRGPLLLMTPSTSSTTHSTVPEHLAPSAMQGLLQGLRASRRQSA